MVAPYFWAREVAVPTRHDVLGALAGGTDYPAAAARLGIHPGMAYLIATGVPADGSDVLTEEETARAGLLSGSSQHLSNPPAHEPDAGDVVQRWLRRRVESDAQIRHAAASRDAMPGPIEDEDATTDLITVLVRQHDQVVALVKQLDTIPGRSKGGTQSQASERESIVDVITKMLSGHETAEEEHFWPHVRRALMGGEEIAETALHQEQEATEMLLRISKTDAQTEEFDELVEKLMTALHQHVALEDWVFSRLRDALSDQERGKIGKQILAALRHAPTRPHPLAPRSPGPAVAAAAKAAVPLDRARDATGRPADREGRPDPKTETEPEPES